MRTAAIFLILGSVSAQSDECTCGDRGRVSLCETAKYSNSDLSRLAKSGMRVWTTIKGDEPPSCYDVRRLVEDGVNVTIDTDHYSAYDLRNLGGKKGRVKLIVRTKKYSAYDLRGVREAGVDLEIRTDHFSVYDLERIMRS